MDGEGTASFATGPLAISVVIPTRDRPHLLTGALRSVLPELSGADEVIVVDSASRVAVEPGLVGPMGRVVRADTPGASLARNLGWLAACNPVVVFVDDDVRVRAGWSTVVRAAFVDPSVSLITARVSVPHGQDPERLVAIKDETESYPIDASTPDQFESTACCAFRRDALADVGGFDERLGPGTWFGSAEDLDLFDRLRRAGCAGRYEPTLEAEHEQWRSRRELLTLEWRYGKGMGAYLWLLANRDRSRARAQARTALWRECLAEIWPAVRLHYEFAVLAQSSRFLGSVVGFARAAISLRRIDWKVERRKLGWHEL